MYVRIYVCMYVCMYVCIGDDDVCAYVCTTHTPNSFPSPHTNIRTHIHTNIHKPRQVEAKEEKALEEKMKLLHMVEDDALALKYVRCEDACLCVRMWLRCACLCTGSRPMFRLCLVSGVCLVAVICILSGICCMSSV